MTVNVIITFGLIVFGVTAGMVATAPDFAVVEIVVALVVGAAVVPVLLYPVTYTLWQALDLAMRPPEASRPPAASARRLPEEKPLGDP